MYLRGSKFNMNRRRRNSNPMLILALLGLIGGMVYINMVVVPVTPPLFIPTSTPTREPISYIREAEDLVSQGKSQQAMDAYKKAIQVDPKNSSIYITLAQMQVFAGDYQNAIDNAQNALVINSNNSMAYAIKGWALGFQGDFLGGQGSIEKALQIDANNGVAYAYSAEVLSLQYQAGKDILGVVQKATDASRNAQRLVRQLLVGGEVPAAVLVRLTLCWVWLAAGLGSAPAQAAEVSEKSGRRIGSRPKSSKRAFS